jgi:stage II sporulation protein D
VELVPAPGTILSYEGRFYTGRLRVSGHAGGLAVVETVTLDQYLLGIREVPFAWHKEALRAQVVAARTYLAWTLQGGRSINGRRYDYDICATTACQVYSGVGDLDGSYGGRWVAAVHETADEILLYQGQPAQAVYSSTSGGRTRNAEDVWPGTDLPYLKAVDSPGEQSPFVTWGFELDSADMESLLAETGLLSGSLQGIDTIVTGDGEGPWRVVIESGRESRIIETWELRAMINRAAEAALPSRLPALRPNGQPYPQTILSPTYTIERIGFVEAGPDGEPLRVTKGYGVSGRGWGHLVGMSQYGALAMAESGSGYQDILSHYYGGLQTVAAPEVLPGNVEVGLTVEVNEAVVAADGPVQVFFDGRPISDAALGTWRFASLDGQIQVTAPAGLGLPPRVTAPSVTSDRLGGVGELLFITETAAEIQVRVFQGPILVGVAELGVVDAGAVRLRWGELVSSRAPGGFVVVIEAHSPDGEHVTGLAVIPAAE